MRKVPATLVLLALLTASCAKSIGGGIAPPVGSTNFPRTIASAANGSVTISSKPSAIVSLSPTATEMLFAIGAGAQVKAVDDQSNYPPQAPKTKLSSFQPNVEAIASSCHAADCMSRARECQRELKTSACAQASACRELFPASRKRAEPVRWSCG